MAILSALPSCYHYKNWTDYRKRKMIVVCDLNNIDPLLNLISSNKEYLEKKRKKFKKDFNVNKYRSVHSSIGVTRTSFIATLCKLNIRITRVRRSLPIYTSFARVPSLAERTPRLSCLGESNHV